MFVKKFSLLLVSIVFFMFSVYSQDTIKYLFIGHCYQINTVGNKVDYRVEQLDKTPYAGIWLGGDVCSEAMLNYSTVQYIDSLFNLGNPETHWSLGNHDARDDNWDWYTEFTGRKTYYAYSSHGITRIVMNTNLLPVNCEMLNDEYNMICNVCDTISQSNYLVLIMHHGIWRGVPGLPPPGTYAQSDLRYWNANCDSVETPFVKTIYPKLLDVKNRGIEVVCIIGDMGAGAKKFLMDSDDGIHFMGCGLYHNQPDNNVLLFTYLKESRKLSWQFCNLDSLLTVQNGKR
jgi:hypothetical protein